MNKENKPGEDDMREEYDIRGGVHGKYYERYKAITAESQKAVNDRETIERDSSN